MTVKLVAGAGEVWDSITAVCKQGKRRRAAVAYVGQHAPQLLPLGRGDILVVNAGDSALLSHATSPVALEVYLNAGVKVFSSPRSTPRWWSPRARLLSARLMRRPARQLSKRQL